MHQFIQPILLTGRLVEHQQSAKFLPRIQHSFFIDNFLTQQSLNLIGYTFAKLIIFVNIFVI